jgi:hypothetical protein
MRKRIGSIPMLFTGGAKDHRERLWDRASAIATAPFAIFPPKKLEVTRLPT